MADSHDHVDLHHHWPDRPLALHLHVHDESSGRVILERLDQILTLVRAAQAQGVTIMATQKELSDELDEIKTAVDDVKATSQAQIAEIAALKAQIAAGTPVSQEQLDALDAKADSILASLGAPPA